MKGIILAGGANTRLFPLTLAVSKQMLPVYDKPMIYYPLSLLMLAGIREIVVVSTPRDTPRFQELLGDGRSLGLTLHYRVQERPAGIAQAFLVAADLIQDEPCTLVLGDNILFGHGLSQVLQAAAARRGGATVFGYEVEDPERYGVVEMDAAGRALSIEEKPARPKSNMAVIGLYMYDRHVLEVARTLTPSARGELEITDLNNRYLSRGALTVERLGRGHVWLDAGTFESLQEASELVRSIQHRQGWHIACIEEIAHRMGLIDAAALAGLAEPLVNNEYGRYLMDIATGKRVRA
ncbi:MAG: glucose-1-phosphate thymidylyltransferase RfbA [Caulobacter sp.]|nr:glucose-1-phosphate thymidylyltransferase RfbA [Caulobacter sp.]